MGDLDEGFYEPSEWVKAEIRRRIKDRSVELLIARMQTLGANLEAAASMAAMYRLGYTKGHSDSELLKAFCEDMEYTVLEPYFPVAQQVIDRLKAARGNT